LFNPPPIGSTTEIKTQTEKMTTQFSGEYTIPSRVPKIARTNTIDKDYLTRPQQGQSTPMRLEQMHGLPPIKAKLHPPAGFLPRSYHRYLGCMALAILCFCVAIFAWGISGNRDHFASTPLKGSADWFENYEGLVTRQMQDRDVYFHNVGHSIENARRADIIILGHSVLEFALVNQQIEEFEQKYHIRIFNMVMPGLASGAFVRRVIKRWDIKPHIWIINTDDHPANFFNDAMDDFAASGSNSVQQIARTSRVVGFFNVARRDIRWAAEKAVARYLPAAVARGLLQYYDAGVSTWRSAINGNYNLEQVGVYNQSHDSIKLIRDQDCHVNEWEIEKARTFLADIGGTSILINVPYERWCPQRVRELAGALGVQTIITADANYSVFDGTHMDKAGGQKYTKFLLNALQNTNSFQQLIGNE
jgi:hypothetical protein